jgi:hypothetical protein
MSRMRATVSPAWSAPASRSESGRPAVGATGPKNGTRVLPRHQVSCTRSGTRESKTLVNECACAQVFGTSVVRA